MIKTYNDLYMDARRRLKAALGDEGGEAASTEARLLLAFAAGKTTADFMRDLRLYVSPAYEQTVEDMLRRREAGEPAAYILGGWEFYGLPFAVSPAVLIPRMDTEVLVDTALELLKETEAPRLLDLCTGSGCIGIALLSKLPAARAVLADLSGEALRLAKKNALLNGVSARAACLQADAAAAPSPLLRDFDLLACNPPYIRSEELGTLDASVRDYEPRLALDGGEDGLDFYRAVCREWPAVLSPGGRLLFECGEAQAADVARIGEANGLRFVKTVKDTIGVERVVVMEKIEDKG